MDSSAPPIKRGRGRPRGSKNKTGAGNVGRPRTDGQPPRKWQNGHDTAESNTPGEIFFASRVDERLDKRLSKADDSILQTLVGDTVTRTRVSAVAMVSQIQISYIKQHSFAHLPSESTATQINTAASPVRGHSMARNVPLKQTTLKFQRDAQGSSPSPCEYSTIILNGRS